MQNDDRPALEALPYHRAMCDYLKSEETEVWQWYASNKVRQDQAEAVRFELLKATYRVERDEQPKLYEAADAVAERLSPGVPITIYQAQNPTGINASLASLPGEAHIVLHGPVASKLTDVELRAVLGHELSHLLLWQLCDGELLIADQVLAAMTFDPAVRPAHFAAARLFALYNEIFCDRGALLVAEDPLAVISMLVKLETELEDVSGESYLRQAEEIFTKGKPVADQFTHPETFIRARAVKLWAEGDPESNAKIEGMIEGAPALQSLDLLGQTKVAALTRRLVDAALAPRWMRTELTLAHARLYFEDYTPAEDRPGDSSQQPRQRPFDPAAAWEPLAADDFQTDDRPLRDYYCFILLDFVTADRDLEEGPLAVALVLSERLGLKERFTEIARKELRLRKKQLEKIDRKRDELIEKADAAYKKDGAMQSP